MNITYSSLGSCKTKALDPHPVRSARSLPDETLSRQRSMDPTAKEFIVTYWKF